MITSKRTRAKSVDELFTVNDYKTLIEMIDSENPAFPAISKEIMKEKHGLCCYEFEIHKTSNIDIWKDGYFVSLDMSRRRDFAGCGMPYKLKDLRKKTYEEIKTTIFNYFEIESIEPAIKQLTLFDF